VSKHTNTIAMVIYKEFTFDSAHFLPNVPDGHKCKNLHGHTYHIKIFIDGPLDEKVGWVMDYGDMKRAWKEVDVLLDHQYLNDIPGLENPTAEVIVVWIWRKLKVLLPQLCKLELKETPSSGVIYEGELE